MDARLREWGARGIIATIVMLWIAIIVADYVTGPQFSLTLFYLIPVGIAAWYLGWRNAVLNAVLGTLAWYAVDYTNGMSYSAEAVRYWNTIIRLGVFLVMGYALAMLRYVLNHERDLARTDSLTGVSNWRHFSELATRELSRARRYRKPITLAYVDVDNFKRVNDSRGHDAGNAVLCEIAAVMQNTFRLTDVVARAGGDEFVILLPDQDQKGARVAIEKVERALGAMTDASNGVIGFSFGVVTANSAPMDVETMVQAADALMYDVKEAGKSGSRYSELEAPIQPAPRTGA